MRSERKQCDPGRDDLVAMLFALHLPQIDLVGLSSVHGNASIEHMSESSQASSVLRNG